jgi:hypothetical protein
MNQWPSSPSVSPWRIGIGPAPTKLSQPARSVRPSTGRPTGFGRSSTQTDLPCRGGGLEHVAQRGDEGVDAAAEVLQVHQQHVERVEHRRRRPPHLAVQAEDGNAVHRIVEVRRLDHVVLLVAAQAVLRAEGRGEPQVAERRERVERVLEASR